MSVIPIHRKRLTGVVYVSPEAVRELKRQAMLGLENLAAIPAEAIARARDDLRMLIPPESRGEVV